MQHRAATAESDLNQGTNKKHINISVFENQLAASVVHVYFVTVLCFSHSAPLFLGATPHESKIADSLNTNACVNSECLTLWEVVQNTRVLLYWYLLLYI